LLTAGKLPAAGNLTRQIVERIAMSFLRSTDKLQIIETKTRVHRRSTGVELQRAGHER
jgi:hypothetical protein